MVIALIAVIAIMVISPRANITLLRTRQAAHKIKSDIRYAQSCALSSQKNTRLSFDSNTDSYSVYVEDSPGNWVILKSPFSQEDFTIEFAQGDYSGVDILETNFNGAGFGLGFDAAGVPHSYDSFDGSMTELSVPGSVFLGEGFLVRIRPLTGKVSIEE